MGEGFPPASNQERAGTGHSEACKPHHDVQGIQVMCEELAHLEGSHVPPADLDARGGPFARLANICVPMPSDQRISVGTDLSFVAREGQGACESGGAPPSAPLG